VVRDRVAEPCDRSAPLPRNGDRGLCTDILPRDARVIIGVIRAGRIYATESTGPGQLPSICQTRFAIHMFDRRMISVDIRAGRVDDAAALQKALQRAGPSARHHEYQQACIPEGRPAVICVCGHVH
jgi:hypothetical protein